MPRKGQSYCPLRGFSIFMRLPFLLIRHCQATCRFAVAMEDVARYLPWLLLPHKALPLGFPFATDAIAVGCLSMPFRLIVGRSLSSGEAPFASGRGHFPVALAPFLFWMQRASVVGRLNVCLPAVAMTGGQRCSGGKDGLHCSICCIPTLVVCLVFSESRCRSHLFFRCEFSVMLRCPLSIL